MNRSKNIGTVAETAVTRYLREHGFPNAERLPLTGTMDKGDIDLIPGSKLMMIQCKSGRAAETASDNQILQWLHEAKQQQKNGGYLSSALVTKRKGYGKDRPYMWTVHVELADLSSIFHSRMRVTPSPKVTFPVSMTLGSWISLLRNYGIGEVF